jgi:protoporphyrinogen oxidase
MSARTAAVRRAARAASTTPTPSSSCDVAVVGAGHNGLVAATLLARAGLNVRVFERAPLIGGACRTEHPFPHAPGVAHSTGRRGGGWMEGAHACFCF